MDQRREVDKPDIEVEQAPRLAPGKQRFISTAAGSLSHRVQVARCRGQREVQPVRRSVGGRSTPPMMIELDAAVDQGGEKTWKIGHRAPPPERRTSSMNWSMAIIFFTRSSVVSFKFSRIRVRSTSRLYAYGSIRRATPGQQLLDSALHSAGGEIRHQSGGTGDPNAAQVRENMI
jgi:hypothetical protein